MPHNPLNTAYARALFEMAQAENIIAQVEEDLFRLRELFKSNAALLEFLKNPNIKREGKRQALLELFENRVCPLTLNALLTLSDQDRVNHLLPIIERFLAIAAESRQKVSGEIVTAIPLDAGTLKRLTNELARITGKNVQLFPKIDPSILGGAIIKIDEQIVDGSLRRKLGQIRERLIQ